MNVGLAVWASPSEPAGGMPETGRSSLAAAARERLSAGCGWLNPKSGLELAYTSELLHLSDLDGLHEPVTLHTPEPHVGE